MQVVVDSLITTYHRSGSGKQILILHGWADSSAGWQAFAAALSKQYQVITLDLPGFGGTEAPTEAWGLAEYAAFVAAFAAKVELDLFAVVGHSNGGAIAVKALVGGILQPRKLVLLAGAGIRDEHGGRKRALMLATKVGKVFTAPLPVRAKQALRSKLYRTVGSDMLVAEHLQETFKRVVGEDIRADAAKLMLPTLLVYGELDTQTPARYGTLLHSAIKNSQLQVVPGADHFLHFGQPERVLQIVEDFLR